MSIPVLRTPPVDAEAGSVEARFWSDLDSLTARYRLRWLDTPSSTPELGPPVGRWRQWRSGRQAGRLIEDLAGEVEGYPDGEAARVEWRERVRERVQRFGEQRLGWPAGYRDLLLGDEFYESTVEFVHAARAFDPDLSPDDLGQALRNVWIMNSLQMLLDLEVGFSPAIFAYSMLYPLTDNYLDDPVVPETAKRTLNRRLGRRLAGERPAASGPREASLYRLVEQIEGQFPRDQFLQVHLSLQAIHRGQVRSLGQQRSGRPLPETLLEISVLKGGSSVLADGYLTAGRLAPDEADFCFGYGVFLQLLDDLQDAESDRRAGHATLFSRLAGVEPLDGLTSRLYRFIHRVLDGSPRFAARRHETPKDLIRRNCLFLLVGAVAENRHLFSRPFLRALDAAWPLRLAALPRLRRRAEKRYRRTARRLRDRRGVDSLLELLE